VSALTPLELSIAMVLGSDGPAPLPASASAPLEALEAGLLGPLRRSPCLVSFSGGRDSSAVLAVATRLARREGLPDPIPATIRAPGARDADESGWQELVVAHLGLDDWMRLEVGDELDVVGPVARRVLRRHGLLWPFNAHFHLPLLEAARGGALMTGIGGDELLRSVTSRRAAAVLAGRVRPKPRDLRRIALDAAPAPLRRRRYARGVAAPPWLTPAAGAAVRRALAAQAAAEPRRLQARMRHVRGLRYLRVGTAGLELLAAGAGARIAHPLLEPGVWAAVAAHAPRGGHLGRTDGMQAIFGDLLPAELLARGDKAGFDEVFFHCHSRAFAERWDEVGVPPAVVDAAALRAHWLGPAPLPQSFSLLQAAWLASADGVEQPLAGDGQRLPAARSPQPPHGQ
jgi:hypothetical protein